MEEEGLLLAAQTLTNHRGAVEASLLTDVTVDVVTIHMMEEMIGGNWCEAKAISARHSQRHRV